MENQWCKTMWMVTQLDFGFVFYNYRYSLHSPPSLSCSNAAMENHWCKTMRMVAQVQLRLQYRECSLREVREQGKGWWIQKNTVTISIWHERWRVGMGLLRWISMSLRNCVCISKVRARGPKVLLCSLDDYRYIQKEVRKKGYGVGNFLSVHYSQKNSVTP